MKTALQIAVLSAAMTLAPASDSAQAAGLAASDHRSSAHSLNLLSDDACDGNGKCESSEQAKAGADDKVTDGAGAETQPDAAGAAAAEPTAKPQTEDSTPAAAANASDDKPKADADKEDAGDKATADEEEDDEWDDGPYEDPLNLDDN